MRCFSCLYTFSTRHAHRQWSSTQRSPRLSCSWPMSLRAEHIILACETDAQLYTSCHTRSNIVFWHTIYILHLYVADGTAHRHVILFMRSFFFFILLWHMVFGGRFYRRPRKVVTKHSPWNRFHENQYVSQQVSHTLSRVQQTEMLMRRKGKTGIYIYMNGVCLCLCVRAWLPLHVELANWWNAFEKNCPAVDKHLCENPFGFLATFTTQHKR